MILILQTIFKVLDVAMITGTWLVLQNTHLVPETMRTLETAIDRKAGIHDNFRLWIITDASEVFPIILLKRSIKGLSWQIY